MQTLEHAECHLAFRVVGNGPPVIFVQGVGLHGDGWLPQVERLSEEYTCLTFDNRGMGRSQPMGSRKLTVPLMAEDVLALADSLGWDDFHLVGHSMGGHIATELALLVPRRVRSLALLSTSARGKDMPPVTLSMIWTGLRSKVGPRRKRRHAFLEMVLPADFWTDDLDEWAERMEPIFGHDLADTPPVVGKQVGAYRGHDATPRLSELKDIPTLVAGGEEDALSPPALSRTLANGIPGATYHEVAGASHGFTVTHSEAANELLANHFAEVESRRRADD